MSAKDIDIIINQPKKAIIKLAVPLFICNLVILLNSFIDSVWIANYSYDAIAAIGFVSPLLVVLSGIANGLGAGSNSCISRYIGAKDYENAENAAVHSMIVSFVISVISTVFLFITLKSFLLLIGAGEVIEDALNYGYIIILASCTIFIPAMMSAIFRAEYAIKRATYPLIFSTVINMILDPIFIFILNWGVMGAALATVVSSTIALILMVYWMFIRKDNFLKVEMKTYKRNLGIYKDIFIVGIPTSVEQFVIFVSAVLMNYWLEILSGAIAVAAYTSSWRLISVGFSPLVAIGGAVLTVAGAAYGGRNLNNFKTTLNYGLKLELISSIIIWACLFIFAGPISTLFAPANSALSIKIISSLKILSFFMIFLPFTVITCNIFRSMGKGIISLILTIFNSAFCATFFTWLFGFGFKLGETGIFIGFTFGMSFGSIILYLFLTYYVKRHEKYFKY
ncbi:MATE family efflux transporter [uncultured Methanobrevibacter sp.]|uniref:MATE family efflux transporter n=1 Tax=uncultured Methanobrevibacter sp. TaxID=253161 RepID=UPI0025DF5D43|nr:MATE family efflux transporter [uncultured Methanobrevibacter sp.]